MKKIAFLFPGQGAQVVGMAKDFFDAFSSAKEVFNEADQLLGRPFSDLIFSGNQGELTKTKNAQLAIYIASIAILRAVQEECPFLQPSVCAGLSLGEYTALTAARKCSFSEALSLVALRGEEMDRACVQYPGTMRVVLGLDEENIRTLLPAGVWVANLNCPGQVVISGEREAIQLAEAAMKARGAKRVLPLEVSGAFHSGLMISAQNALRPALERVSLGESDIDLVMNVTGGIVREREAMRDALIQQVISPVYWERGIRTMMAQGIEVYFELGPGKTLAGMNQRIGIPVPTISIEKVEDLKKITAWREHATIASR